VLFTRKYYDQQLNEVLPLVQQLLEQQDQYRNAIEQAANTEIHLRDGVISEIPVLEFSSDTSRLGYKITELARRIQGSEQLSEFVARVGSKLTRGATPDVFEAAIIGRVLENAVINKDADVGETSIEMISECRLFEQAMQKYTVQFL
jgi:hypothetical protein